MRLAGDIRVVGALNDDTVFEVAISETVETMRESPYER